MHKLILKISKFSISRIILCDSNYCLPAEAGIQSYYQDLLINYLFIKNEEPSVFRYDKLK